MQRKGLETSSSMEARSSSAHAAPVVDIPMQGPIAGIDVPLARFSEDDDGCREGGVAAYLGIPFAEPPVGMLRWKRPQRPAPSWRTGDSQNSNGHTTPRPSQWRPDPVQDLSASAFYSHGRRNPNAPPLIDLDSGVDDSVGEDCLYLNLWVPQGVAPVSKSDGENGGLPVLVWVYGGGFVTGSASQPMFDGARLCHETGCIVVSITYRVGILGFLGARQLAAAEEGGKGGTGNYGLWDIVAGFEWVQENISVFGGDPRNVMAFGESAGAIALHDLLLSPVTPTGLFARVCLESGTAMTVLPRTLPSAQATFDALATRLGAPLGASDDDKMAVLYSASPRELMLAASHFSQRRPRTEYIVDKANGRPARRMDVADQADVVMDPSALFGPTWDGVMIDDKFLQHATDGIPTGGFRNAQRGIVLGCTADEGTLFSLMLMAPKNMHNNVAGYHPSMRPLVEALYGTKRVSSSDASFAVASAYSGDQLFSTPVLHLMARLGLDYAAASPQDVGNAPPPTYGYLHTHRPSTQLLRSTVPEESVSMLALCGSLHMAELSFVFGYDGSQGYTYARQAYPCAYPTNAPQDKQPKGFTPAERVMSLQWMRAVAAFAQGEAPWSPVLDTSSPATRNGGAGSDMSATSLSPTAHVASNLRVMLFDDMPRTGATTPRAVEAVQAAAADAGGTRPILVRECRVQEALMWSEPVQPTDLQLPSSHEDGNSAPGASVSVGTSKDKFDFWSRDGFRNVLLAYYGDERIHFLP